MVVIKPQPIDARHVKAGDLLGLPPEQIAVQFCLIGADRLYAWEKPLGKTVLVDGSLNAQEFDPGILLPEAISKFDLAHPETQKAQPN